MAPVLAQALTGAAPAESAAMTRHAEPTIATIVRELAAVADYIAHLNQEIGALRANELCRERIPSAHHELDHVVDATASATNIIMKAAEEILGSDSTSLEDYRDQVEARVLTIFEACSFQDITGQRISRVAEALSQLEKRLSRFVAAVNARDLATPPDCEEAQRQARRETLLLHGPQDADEAIAQDDIDKLFG